MSNYIIGAILELKDKAFTSNVKESASATQELKKDLGKASKESEGFGKKLKSAGKKAAIGIAGTATAAAGAGAGIFAMTRKVTSGFDDISKTSQKLGITTDAFQEFSYWADQNGIKASTMERGIGRLNQRIGQAAQGNDKYADALTALGVSMDDVKAGTVTTEDAMAKSLQTLSEMTNEQEKSALASELFGTRLARDLMPALNDGSMSFEEAKKAAEEMGLVIDEDVIDSAVKLEDTWTDLTAMFSTFGQEALAGTIPFFQKVLDFAIEKMPVVREKISSGFDRARGAVSWLGEKGREVFDVIRTKIEENQPTVDALKENFTSVKDTVVDLYDEAKPIFSWIGEEGIPLIADAMGEVIVFAMDIYNTIVGNWDKIEPFVIGIVAAIGLWKTVTIAHTAVTSTMTAAQWAFNAALNANPIGLVIIAIGALIGIGITLYRNWDTIKERTISLWETVKEKFAGIKDSIFNALEPVLDFFGRLKSAWDNFKSSISNFKMPKIGLPKWMGGDGLIQGSHRTGLNYVPHDGYVAELHKGEAVLPRHEAEKYRKGQATHTHSQKETIRTSTQSTQSNNTIYINVNAQDKSPEQFANEFVPILKQRLANI